MIDGVVVKHLVTHGDDRGFFREIVRATDPRFDRFGQLSHSLVATGVVKAWHGHIRQTQWTYMATGSFRVAIWDRRPGSTTHGELVELTIDDEHPPVVYEFPPGVVHGYRCLAGPGHVIYLTSGTYDLDDEVRIAADDPVIGYDWFAQPSSKPVK